MRGIDTFISQEAISVVLEDCKGGRVLKDHLGGAVTVTGRVRT